MVAPLLVVPSGKTTSGGNWSVRRRREVSAAANVRDAGLVRSTKTSCIARRMVLYMGSRSRPSDRARKLGADSTAVRTNPSHMHAWFEITSRTLESRLPRTRMHQKPTENSSTRQQGGTTNETTERRTVGNGCSRGSRTATTPTTAQATKAISSAAVIKISRGMRRSAPDTAYPRHDPRPMIRGIQ